MGLSDTERQKTLIETVPFARSSRLLLLLTALAACETHPKEPVAHTHTQSADSTSSPQSSLGVKGESTPPSLLPDELEQLRVPRARIRDEWVHQARKIAEQAHNPIAQKIVTVLENSLLVVPSDINGTQIGMRILETLKDPSSPWIYFMVLLPDEKQPSAIWGWTNGHGKTKEGTIFDPHINALMVNGTEDSDFNPFDKGIAALHEGHHIYEFIHGADLLTPEGKTLSEVNTYSFCQQLMLVIGGEPYRRALKEEMARIEHGVAMNAIPPPAEYNLNLDLAFGKARSEKEMTSRETALWFHAFFALADAHYPPAEAEHQKENFIFTMYKGIEESK